jgi:hypothetical protein
VCDEFLRLVTVQLANDATREIVPILRYVAESLSFRTQTIDSGRPYDYRSELRKCLERLDFETRAGHCEVHDNFSPSVEVLEAIHAAQQFDTLYAVVERFAHRANDQHSGIRDLAADEGPRQGEKVANTLDVQSVTRRDVQDDWLDGRRANLSNKLEVDARGDNGLIGRERPQFHRLVRLNGDDEIRAFE